MIFKRTIAELTEFNFFNSQKFSSSTIKLENMYVKIHLIRNAQIFGIILTFSLSTCIRFKLTHTL